MSNVMEVYKPLLASWPKEAGPKPTQKDLKLIHDTGIARPGSKTAMAVAMSLREKGATQDQIKKVLGAPYRNKLTTLVATGVARREHVSGEGRLMVYKLRIKVAA